MSLAKTRAPAEDWLETARTAVGAMEALLADAILATRRRVSRDGRPSNRLIEQEQRATHGLAWFATYVEALRQLAAYAERMRGAERLQETEILLVAIGMGEFLAQLLGGIPMSQGEIARPGDFGLTAAQVAARITPAVERLIATGNSAVNRARVV